MKKGFYGLAALIIAVACYGVNVTYNSKNGLTRLTLLNVEALANDEFTAGFKQCYIFTSTTLLPDEPAFYVTSCNDCNTVKSTTSMGASTCAGSFPNLPGW